MDLKEMAIDLFNSGKRVKKGRVTMDGGNSARQDHVYGRARVRPLHLTMAGWLGCAPTLR